jgi:hypothetical protein
VNVLGKSPSPMRVAVIAGAVALLASAMTPVHAASPVAKERVAKKRPPTPPPAPVPSRTNSGGGGGGTGGPVSLDWTISAALRP